VRRSNGYIIIFTAILTIVVGGLLSLTSLVLGPAQKKSIELDTKSQILSAVMQIQKGDDILDIYRKRIQSVVVDARGNEITTDEKGKPIQAENIDIAKNFKKTRENRQYPVFKFMNKENELQVDAYILPIYGNGLWDKVWGFVAVDEKFESIVGVSFAHKAETPGLGARIATTEIQTRFEGKKILNEAGEVVSVTMQKGEKGGGQASIDAFAGKPHQVDGMSGATLTAKGVNNMMLDYLTSYKPYFEKVKSQVSL